MNPQNLHWCQLCHHWQHRKLLFITATSGADMFNKIVTMTTLGFHCSHGDVHVESDKTQTHQDHVDVEFIKAQLPRLPNMPAHNQTGLGSPSTPPPPHAPPAAINVHPLDCFTFSYVALITQGNRLQLGKHGRQWGCDLSWSTMGLQHDCQGMKPSLISPEDKWRCNTAIINTKWYHRVLPLLLVPY